MSRYLILILLNLPLVTAGVLHTVVAYKLKRTSYQQFWLRLGLWAVVLLGLLFAAPIYAFLFSNNLTQTEPLSLFDVIQITGIVFTFSIASRTRTKVDLLERRVHDLHQELSIRLAQESRPPDR